MHRHEIITVNGPAGPEQIDLFHRSQGEELFLAWHGITGVNGLWLWDVLWERGQTVLAGLPGHGPVAPRPLGHYLGWSPEHFISVGLATARLLAEGRRITLIGHSTGGLIALGVAMAAPELVERLILVAPVVWDELDGIVALWASLRDRPRLLWAAVAASLIGGRLSFPAFRWSLRFFVADRAGFYGNPRVEQVLRAAYDDYRRTPLAGIAGTARVIGGADLRPALVAAPPSVPTLILHGEADGIVPIAQSRWLAERLPSAELRTLPGLGHVPYGEQEEAFNRLVAEWLEAQGVPARG